MKRLITWQMIYERIRKLPKGMYYGIPRGGQYISGATGCAVDSPYDADYIIDDLYDSGKTFNRWKEMYPDKKFVFLFDKRKEYKNEWLVFPWELEDETKDVDDHIARILQHANTEVNDIKINLIKKLTELL